MASETDSGTVHEQSNLVVQVRYITSTKKFIDSHAEASQTLASVKARALAFFGLDESGGKTYDLVYEGSVIRDTNMTLGQLVEHQHELRFDLIEQFKQG